MAGVGQTSASKTWRPARSTTYNTTPLSITPCKGFGVGRLFCFSDAAGTLSIQQKPRNGTPGGSSTSPSFSFRQTDSYTVTASGTTQVFDFNVRGDYAKVTFTPTAGNPTTFEFEATFYP